MVLRCIVWDVRGTKKERTFAHALSSKALFMYKCSKFHRQKLKFFHIQSGTKVTWYSMFNMLPLVTSDFCSTLYFVSCSVIVTFVGISLISAIAVWPYFLILFHVRNRFSIIMIMLPWGCSQHSSIPCLFMYWHNSIIMCGLLLD